MIKEFWNRVDKSGDCWVWTGARNSKGYGCLSVFNHSERAHRLVWELTFGEIPEGMHVLHHCDNPPCVRADHLFLGTHQDNSDDKIAKGRGFRPASAGVLNGMARLTEGTVLEIRQKYKREGITVDQLVAEFGVSKTHVRCIVLGQRWKHLPL